MDLYQRKNSFSLEALSIYGWKLKFQQDWINSRSVYISLFITDPNSRKMTLKLGWGLSFAPFGRAQPICMPWLLYIMAFEVFTDYSRERGGTFQLRIRCGSFSWWMINSSIMNKLKSDPTHRFLCVPWNCEVLNINAINSTCKSWLSEKGHLFCMFLCLIRSSWKVLHICNWFYLKKLELLKKRKMKISHLFSSLYFSKGLSMQKSMQKQC